MTMEVKPESSPYTAYGAARKLWSCRDDEILMEGPAGTGKTRAILEKINFCCMKYPNIRVLIVRKTRESMTESVLVTLEEKVFPRSSPLKNGPMRRLRTAYHYPNGSELIVGGMDKSAKVMSTEYDIIGTFESTELSLDDFESLTTRNRNFKMPYQQVIADCNPGAPTHWLNKRPEKSGMTRLLSRHEDNPVLFDSKLGKWTESGLKYIAKLDRLSGHRRARLRFGRWAAAEGLVYDTWDSNVHLIEKFSIPSHWRKIRSIDFGFNNPFVCQWWAVSPDGDLICYREWYMSNRTVGQHAPIIKRLSAGETYEVTVCDHDREDRQTLHNEDIFTIPAYKDILRGIQGVKDRLAIGANKKPRLFRMQDILVERDTFLEEKAFPVSSIEEFDAYQYRKTEDGKTIKEEPLDKDNHGMDAMRYAVAYFDNLQGMNLKVEADEATAVYA